MPTSPVTTEVNNLFDKIMGVVSSTVYLVLFAIATALPVAWLWDNVLVSYISVLGPVGNDFWPAVVFLLALVAVLRFFGFSLVEGDVELNPGGVVDAVLRVVYASLPVWAVYLVAWLLVEYVV